MSVEFHGDRKTVEKMMVNLATISFGDITRLKNGNVRLSVCLTCFCFNCKGVLRGLFGYISCDFSLIMSG